MMPASKKSSHSKLCLDHVHDQVLVEIFKRLPIKPVYRCKCVSKRWFNVISSPYFTENSYKFHHTHVDQSVPAFALICYDTEGDGYCRRDNNNGADKLKLDLLLFHDHKSSEFSLDSLATPQQSPPYKKFLVLSSNNGLVLCCTEPNVFARRYFVCNPLNKVRLPISPLLSTDTDDVGFICKAPFFSINNDKNTTAGSDRTIYSLRIVRLIDTHGIFKLEIYASETGLWTEHILDNTKNSNLLQYAGYYGRPVACNGLLYWETHRALIVIDPYKFQSRVVKLPHSGQRRHGQKHFIGECKGTVRMIRHQKRTLTIYELEDQDICASKWSFVKEIDLHCDISSVIFHPFNEDIIYLRQTDRVLFYNIKEETFKVIWPMIKSHRGHYLKVFPVVLPLCPLSESPHKKRKTEGTFEALTNYSSIPMEDYSESRASDDDIRNNYANYYYSDDYVSGSD